MAEKSALKRRIFMAFAIVLAGGAGLIAAALLWINYDFERNLTPADRLVLQARGNVKKKDYEHAESLYREALALVQKSPDRGDKYLCKFQDLGDFLRDRIRYKEAQAVYLSGLEAATAEQNKTWQSLFNQRIAVMQYFAIKAEAVDKADPNYGLKAIELDPEHFKKPTYYAANTFCAIAQSYLALGNYPAVDQWAAKANEMYKQLPEGAPGRLYRTEVDALVKRGKLKDANDLFIKRMSECKDNSDMRDLREGFYESMDSTFALGEKLSDETKQLFEAKKWEELDKLALRLSSAPELMANERWPIWYFLRGLPETEDYAAESVWQDRLRSFQEWNDKRPDSDAAKVGMGWYLVTYAWKARGSGHANTVTNEGWEKFRKRLDQSWSVLQKVKTRGPECYLATQRLALGQSWENDRYDPMYNACRSKFPTFYGAISTQAYRLQPRWHGEEGEAKKFLQSEVAKLPADQADIVYSIVVASLDRGPLSDVFHQTDFSWERTKAGLQKRIKRDPKVIDPRASLSCLALEMGEQRTAEAAFAGIP